MGSLNNLIEALDRLDDASFSDDASRVRLQHALLKTTQRLRRPMDIALDHTFFQPVTTTAVKTLLDANVWTAWVKNGAGPLSCRELADLTGSDEILLKRLLRYLATQQLVHESDGEGTFELTAYSRALADPAFAAAYTVFSDFKQPLWANFPVYAAQTEYKNPVDASQSNFKSWTGEADVFTWMNSKAKLGEAFNSVMATFSASKVSWTDIYPTDAIAAIPAERNAASVEDDGDVPGGALVVDIGGNSGHDLEKFRSKHPDVPQGSLVLQDLEAVVDNASVQPPIVKQAIDMFVAQPVKGAYIYYLHAILHDWPDDLSVKILQVIKKAMKPGYSRILLHESVIAEVDPHPRTVLSDLVMMMTFSAGERDLGQWKNVIEQAGLEIKHVYLPNAPDSIIELMLPE